MTSTPPSTPPSPTSPIQGHNDNSLSDIFSDSPPSTPTQADVPSDIPRLRSTHTTAGYRAGISVSRTQSLQPGFDEGYSLGAVFGLRIGYILGALEGIWGAYDTQSGERSRLSKLLKRARDELRIEKVFAPDHWDKDGVWTYEVIGEQDVVTFEEVAQQHPVVRKWNEIVKEEVQNAGLKLGRFEGSEWEAGRISGDTEAMDP